MKPATEREALVAFGQAMDKLRQANHPLSLETAEVLKLYFLSGCQWGLDHAFMEKSKIIVPPQAR